MLCRGEGDSTQAKEQKEKLQGDLNTLLEDQCNQMKKKKDTHATEVTSMSSLHSNGMVTLEKSYEKGYCNY